MEKLFWKLRNRDFVPISWNFLMEKLNLAKSCCCFFLIYTYHQRDATNEYCEVLNMNLNIWFDIPSKYIENFCVIVSVTVGIFSKRLTDTSCQDFLLWFFCGISLVMVKTDVKSVFWRVSFSRPGLPFFSFFVFVPFAYYML